MQIVLSISTFKLSRFAWGYINVASPNNSVNSAYTRTQKLLKKARRRILVFHHVIWLFGGVLSLGAVVFDGTAKVQVCENLSQFRSD